MALVAFYYLYFDHNMLKGRNLVVVEEKTAAQLSHNSNVLNKEDNNVS